MSKEDCLEALGHKIHQEATKRARHKIANAKALIADCVRELRDEPLYNPNTSEIDDNFDAVYRLEVEFIVEEILETDYEQL